MPRHDACSWSSLADRRLPADKSTVVGRAHQEPEPIPFDVDADGDSRGIVGLVHEGVVSVGVRLIDRLAQVGGVVDATDLFRGDDARRGSARRDGDGAFDAERPGCGHVLLLCLRNNQQNKHERRVDTADYLSLRGERAFNVHARYTLPYTYILA